MVRSGPKPLPFQLGLASLASAGLAGGATFSADMLQKYFAGIKKYQEHKFKRSLPPLVKIWEAGQARMFYAQNDDAPIYKSPVVLIPSMVNKSDILDLLPDKSLLRYFAGQGFDAHLFDWGHTAEDKGQADFDAAISQRLIPALESFDKPVLLLGYCMGGLFAAAVAALRPDLVRGIVMLAAPWNFHDEAAALKARMAIMKPSAMPYMAQYGRLPESWMQGVFASLDPEGSIKKFASFADMKEGDARENVFMAVEDWLNEGVDLPAGIARLCMEDWYERNLPHAGEWIVCGKAVQAAEIKCPTFVVAAQNDKIVPPDSAMAFADQRAKCDRLLCKTGHVGLIASSRAADDIWKPIADWFAVQQQ